MPDQKIALVTGATGFTGRHMVDLLLEKGYEVIATDLKNPNNPVFIKSGVRFIPADLTNFRDLERGGFFEAVRRVDCVFHIAGIFDHSASLSKLMEVNIWGTKNLLRILERSTKKPRVIVWGGAGIFGDFKHIPLPATENMPPKTNNPYFLSKWLEEREAFECGRLYDLPVTVIRPSGVYGPHSIYGMAFSITTMLKSKLAVVIGNGKNIGALVHVRDVVRAAEFLAQKNEAAGETYHVTDDTPYSTKEIAQCLAKLCEARCLPIKVPLWLALLIAPLSKIHREIVRMTVIDTWLSNEKIKKLGFEFEYPDSRIGLAETVAWYKSHK